MRLCIYTGITGLLMLLAAFIGASDTSTFKGSFVLNGKAKELKHAYACVKPDTFSENDVVLVLLFSEKSQGEPQNEFQITPVALKFETHLTSPNLVRFGSSLITKEGTTSIMSTADKIALTSFQRTKVEGKIFHESPEHSWDIQFSLPLLLGKNMKPLETAPLGEPLPADGGTVVQGFRSYLKALSSGDPGTVRKFTTSDFGKIFSMPQMRIVLLERKNTFSDDIEILSGVF